MKFGHVVLVLIAVFIGCIYETRVIWKDAVLMLSMYPLVIWQTLAPNIGLPDVEEVRQGHLTGKANFAKSKLQYIRWTTEFLDWTRKKVAPDFIKEFMQTANTTYVKIPSSNENSLEIKLLVINPLNSSPSRPLILFIHGGGMATGSEDTVMAYKLAYYCSATVVSVDYRLAPEHPFPAGVNDAYDALLWSMKNAKNFGADPKKTVVAGESGGGLLAASTSQRARDENLVPRLKAQFLFIPMLRYPGQGTGSWREFFHVPGLGAMVAGWFWEAYSTPLGCFNARCSPVLDSKFDGLPFSIVAAAYADVLRDDSAIYVDLLKQAGVPVEHFVIPTSHIGAVLFETHEQLESINLLRNHLENN